jgi:hypothetical protein
MRQAAAAQSVPRPGKAIIMPPRADHGVTGRTTEVPGTSEDRRSEVAAIARTPKAIARARSKPESAASLQAQLRVLVMRLGTERTRALIEQIEHMKI